MTGLPRSSVAAISAWMLSFPSMTPGMFIISPSPATPSQPSASRISAGPELGAGVLEPRQRGHARRHGQEDLQRQVTPLVEHPAHALEAEDVRHLVVVDERGRRPVREHRLGEARDGDHHRLDVQVGVDQARDEVRALGVDRLGLRADRVRDVAEHRHAAVRDRHVRAVEHLARVHVHEPAAADDEVGGPPAHADRGQLARELGQRAARH